MKKISNIIALLIIVAVAGSYYFFGPSVFYGGPTKNTIIEVTRSVMVATPSDASAIANNIKITPSGFCSKDDGKFACMVTLTMPDGTQKDFISLLRKDDSGKWQAAN